MLRSGSGDDVRIAMFFEDHAWWEATPALRAALAAGCRYVGLLGGRRTQRLRRESLAEHGVDDAALEGIRGPIGLDIGASAPAEIAVAILAEMLAARLGAPVGDP